QKQQSLYNGNLLLKEHDPPTVYDSEETLELAQESREKMRLLKKEIKPANYAKINHLSGVFVPQTTKSKEELFFSNVSNMVTISKMISIPNEDLSDNTTPIVARKFLNEISHDKAYNDMQQKVERLQAQFRDFKGKSSNTPSVSNTLGPLNQKLESKIVELEFQVINYKREISHLKTTYKNLFNSIKSNRAHAKLHDLIFKNAKLRARLFENTLKSVKNISGTSVTPHVDKPKLSAINPLSKKLHVSMSSHSIPQPREFNVVKHRNVIAPGMFKISPSQTPRASVGQFCDADLEVAFRRNTCFIRDLDGVDLIKGNRSTNLYTINLYDMALASPICRMARATPTKKKQKSLTPTQTGSEFKAAASSTSYGFVWSNEYFDSVGISHETSAAKTPQQNGVVERRNRTLVEAARTIVYNRRTRKIMETMNVTFNELSAIDFEQNSSRPELQSMTSGQISSELKLTYAPSTITPQRPSKRDLDILFNPLHNETGRNSLSHSCCTGVSSQNVDATSQQHAQQQRNLITSPTASAADNVSNVGFEGGLFVNPFGTPSTESVVSSTQYVDPSNMHTFYQPYPHDYQWTKDHPLE
nr:integrase, catalytic region, zinc finger, CCHC-type, peptidase aspartic, catalytic [Tanacetum cinerariifolium]